MANGRLSTSILINDSLLIDAGTGLGSLTVEEMLGIEDVFLTHSHVDHIAALSALGDMRLGRQAPLRLHALPETLEALSRHFFNGVLWPDFTTLPHRDKPVFVHSPLTPGQVVRSGSLQVRPFRAVHPVPALGFTLDDGRSSLVFSGDTGPGGDLLERLHERPVPDLLIVECAFPDRYAEVAATAGHYTPRSLAVDLSAVSRPRRIAITHLKPGLESEIRRDCRRHELEDVTFLEDGQLFTL